MGNHFKAANPVTVHGDKKRQANRLAKRRESPQFLEHLRSLRNRLAGGQGLLEIRHAMGVEDKLLWDDMVASLAQSFANPEVILLEWQIRQQSRYASAAELMRMAKDEVDKDERFEKLSRAIMIAQKVDEATLELQKALGVLKPIDIIDIGPNGQPQLAAPAKTREELITEIEKFKNAL